MKQKKSPESKLVYGYTTPTDDANLCELWGDYFHDLFTNESEESFDNNIYSNITTCVKTYF